jgi:hypothetical protein
VVQEILRCGISTPPMSPWGQKRRFDPQPVTSGLPQSTDIAKSARLVRLVPEPEIRSYSTNRLLFDQFVGRTPAVQAIIRSRESWLFSN